MENILQRTSKIFVVQNFCLIPVTEMERVQLITTVAINRLTALYPRQPVAEKMKHSLTYEMHLALYKSVYLLL